MLREKKEKRYSRKALRTRRRRIRRIRVMCVYGILFLIVIGIIRIGVELKNNWHTLIVDDGMDNPHEEIYVIKASTEEKTISDSLTDRTGVRVLGTNMDSGTDINPETILVNKQNPVPVDYEISLHMLKNGQQVAALMYEDLRDMLFTGEAEEEVSFIVSSGYRDEDKQKQLLQEEIDKNLSAGMNYEEAQADALLTVAPAGHSEHETGLAVDIVAETNQRLDDTQEYTRENQWLQENCYKYGFILRYPEGKEDITGISYESWHFRYVGKEAAKEITEKGITLEEYLE